MEVAYTHRDRHTRAEPDLDDPSSVDGPHRLARQRYCLLISLLALAMLIRLAGDIHISSGGHSVLDDDAYYYMVTARNLAIAGKMTFDGHSITNGYHPLWFWIQALGYRLGMSRLSTTQQAIAVLGLQYVMFGVTLAAMMWWLWRNRAGGPAIPAAVLGLILIVYPKHVSAFLSGTETVLLLPLLILFLYYAWTARRIRAGLVGCLLVLSRLDTIVYVVVPVAILAALQERASLRRFMKSGVQVACPSLVVTLVLMIVYRVTFGYPVPVHGVCRSCFPAVHVQWHHLTWQAASAFRSGNLSLLASANPATSLVILPVCGLLLLRKGNLSPGCRAGALWLVVLGLVQLASFAFFQKWAKPISPWYLAPLVVFTCGAVAAAAMNMVGSRAILRICLVAAGLVVIASGVREGPRACLQCHPSRLEAFVKARSSDAVWAATDCGNICFRTGRRFVNLDGLINGFDYQAALRDGELKSYLRDAGVRYLLVGVWQRSPRVEWFEPMYAHRANRAAFDGDYDTLAFYVYSYMYGCWSDTLTLRYDQEVWRSAVGIDGTVPARTLVFDIAASLQER
jgi:hypothetical protein